MRLTWPVDAQATVNACTPLLLGHVADAYGNRVGGSAAARVYNQNGR